jgi:hypothetical protein
LVNVPVPVHVELRHETVPEESAPGPSIVKVRPDAKNVAFAEFNVKPATVASTLSVTV